MVTTKCKGCGKEIIFGSGPRGQRIPIDMKPPVYQIVDDPDADSPMVMRVALAGVSHFATCSEANRFSGSNRRKTDIQADLDFECIERGREQG